MYDKKRELYVYSENVWRDLLKQNQKSFHNERLKQLIQSVMKNIDKHHFHGDTRKNGHGHGHGHGNGHGHGKRYHHNHNNNIKNLSHKSFGGSRFKSTKTREHSDIYGLLNKLTETTYNKIKSEFLVIFSNKEHVEKTNQNNIQNNIQNNKNIFSIVIQESCNNILHVHLYAKLIYEIIVHRRECLEYYKEKMFEFKEKVIKSKSIDSISDYDILCKINKENECIKGFCILNFCLFIYLCSNTCFHVDEPKHLYDFIGYLFECLENSIDNEEIERMNAICGFVHKMFVLESHEIKIFISKDKEHDNKIVKILERSIEKCSKYIRCHMKLTDIHMILSK